MYILCIRCVNGMAAKVVAIFIYIKQLIVNLIDT